MRDAKWILHTAVDDLGTGFIDFIPMVSKAWRAFYGAKISICIVGALSRETYTEQYGQHADFLRVVEPVDGLGVAPQAKLARAWSACNIDSTLPVMIDDVDWVPLSFGFFDDKFLHWRDGCVLRMGLEVYDTNKEDKGKAPMGTATATPDVFAEVYETAGLTFAEFCAKECERESIDCLGRDNPKHPDNFSDESMLRRSILRWNKSDRIIDIVRGWDDESDTISRPWWNLFDANKMRDGGYIGSHMPRPYARYQPLIAPIEAYINREYEKATQ